MTTQIYRRGSFGGLAGYLEKGANPQDVPAARVAWTDSRNLLGEGRSAAVAQMRATAGRNERAGQPAIHVVLSWKSEAEGDGKEGEVVADRPSERQMRETARRVLADERVGLGEHQAWIVAHGDTDTPHVHLMVNAVHPETGRVWNGWKERQRFAKVLREIEEERRWAVPQGGRMLAERGYAGEESSPERYHEHAAAAGEAATMRQRAHAELGEVLAGAGSWDEIESALAASGFEMEPRRSGFVVTDGSRHARMSWITRGVSRRQWEERFGETWVEHRAQAPERSAEEQGERPAGRERIAYPQEEPEVHEIAARAAAADASAEGKGAGERVWRHTQKRIRQLRRPLRERPAEAQEEERYAIGHVRAVEMTREQAAYMSQHAAARRSELHRGGEAFESEAQRERARQEVVSGEYLTERMEHALGQSEAALVALARSRDVWDEGPERAGEIARRIEAELDAEGPAEVARRLEEEPGRYGALPGYSYEFMEREISSPQRKAAYEEARRLAGHVRGSYGLPREGQAAQGQAAQEATWYKVAAVRGEDGVERILAHQPRTDRYAQIEAPSREAEATREREAARRLKGPERLTAGERERLAALPKSGPLTPGQSKAQWRAANPEERLEFASRVRRSPEGVVEAPPAPSPQQTDSPQQTTTPQHDGNEQRRSRPRPEARSGGDAADGRHAESLDGRDASERSASGRSASERGSDSGRSGEGRAGEPGALREGAGPGRHGGDDREAPGVADGPDREVDATGGGAGRQPRTPGSAEGGRGARRGDQEGRGGADRSDHGGRPGADRGAEEGVGEDEGAADRGDRARGRGAGPGDHRSNRGGGPEAGRGHRVGGEEAGRGVGGDRQEAGEGRGAGGRAGRGALRGDRPEGAAGLRGPDRGQAGRGADGTGRLHAVHGADEEEARPGGALSPHDLAGNGDRAVDADPLGDRARRVLDDVSAAGLSAASLSAEAPDTEAPDTEALRSEALKTRAHLRAQLERVAESPERAVRQVERLYEARGLEGMMETLAERPEEVFEVKREGYFWDRRPSDQARERAREAFRPAGSYAAHQAVASYALARERATLGQLAEVSAGAAEARAELEEAFGEVYARPEEALARYERQKGKMGPGVPERLLQESPRWLGDLKGERVGFVDGPAREEARAKARGLAERYDAWQGARSGVRQFQLEARRSGPTIEAMRERFGSAVGVIEAREAGEVLREWGRGREARVASSAGNGRVEAEAATREAFEERLRTAYREASRSGGALSAAGGSDYLRREVDEVTLQIQQRGELEGHVPALRMRRADAAGDERAGEEAARASEEAEHVIRTAGEVWEQAGEAERARIELAVRETAEERVPEKVRAAASIEVATYTQWRRAQEEQQQTNEQQSNPNREQERREQEAAPEQGAAGQKEEAREHAPAARGERPEHEEMSQEASLETPRPNAEQRRVGQEPGGAVSSTLKRVSAGKAPGLEDRTQAEGGGTQSVENERVMEPARDENTADALGNAAEVLEAQLARAHREAHDSMREQYSGVLQRVAASTPQSSVTPRDVERDTYDAQKMGAHTKALYARASKTNRRKIERGSEGMRASANTERRQRDASRERGRGGRDRGGHSR